MIVRENGQWRAEHRGVVIGIYEKEQDAITAILSYMRTRRLEEAEAKKAELDKIELARREAIREDRRDKKLGRYYPNES